MEHTSSQMLDDFEGSIAELAFERTADLLPLLYERLMSKESLDGCARHAILRQRVRAEIALHRAYKALRDGSYIDRGLEFPVSYKKASKHYDLVEKVTKRIRAEYRSQPCTCWVPKR